MKIPSFLKSTTSSATIPPPKETSVNGGGRQWKKWPSCNYPDTLSFRCPSSSAAAFDGIFKTLNSIYLDSSDNEDEGFVATNTEDHTGADFRPRLISFSADTDSDDDSETVVRGIRSSDRLFFDPDQLSSAINWPQKTEDPPKENRVPPPSPLPPTKGGFPFSESVVLAMESEDPYSDFRKSMEEMVEFQGIDYKDWDRLEELLHWYLNVNGNKNHGFIVGAFLDLLVAISAASGGGGCDSASSTASFSSAITCLSPSHSSSTTNSDSSSPPFRRRLTCRSED